MNDDYRDILDSLLSANDAASAQERNEVVESLLRFYRENSTWHMRNDLFFDDVDDDEEPEKKEPTTDQDKYFDRIGL